GPEGIRLSAFLVLRRFIVDEIVQYKNPYPYITGLIVRTTHNIANVDMEQAAREVGHSGYTLRKLLGLWLNGFTAFSVKPLRVATMLGLLSSFAGVIFAIITIVRRIILPNVQVGWSSLAVLILIIGGLILFVLGIMGEYVGRIYMCMNNTPQFIVRDMTAEMRDTVNGDRKDLA
ncbi:MAG: glycosyltransferase, partial [Lachnospiraceae bacterium]|nr:glycosyltransferase [Lachnospiraceae bacterium]